MTIGNPSARNVVQRGLLRAGLPLAMLAGMAAPAHAQFKVTETFTNSTAPGWLITGTDNASTNDDSGILTGGYGNITATGTNDPNGDGWLRLTTRSGYQIARALYTGSSFPSSQGVTVEFSYISWGGNGADGITFFLYNAANDMSGAVYGGSLGYCYGAGAYLGIGIDEYGNFSAQSPASDACPAGSNSPGFQADRIVIRGPTAPANGNQFVASAATPGSIDSPGATSRPAVSRMRIALVPNGSGGYRVSTGLGQNGAAITSLSSNVNFPYAAPANLRMGYAASTGGLNNIHEIRDLVTSTPADIVVTKTVSAPTILRGLPVSYTVTVLNNDINPVDGGNQSPAIPAAHAPDITDTFPAQLQNATWTCAATAGSTCPAASGSGNISYAGGYTLASGGQLTFTINATVATTAACNATVSNTASASFSDTDGFSDINPGDNAATAAFTVVCPQLTVSKTTLGGVGTFNFSGSNGIANHAVTTAAAGTPVAGATQTLTSAGVATTITEAAPSGGFALTGIACTGLGTGGTATADLANRTVTLDAAATTTAGPITCTFTNTKAPILRLQKQLPNGRFAAGDQFTLGISGPSGTSVTTTGAGSTANGTAAVPTASVGASYTFNETGASGANLANYASSYACTNAYASGTPGVTGDGTSFNLVPQAGDDLSCIFTNTRNPQANLSITKTNNAAQVVSGTNTTYVITVTNDGPDAVTGAVVRDSPDSGLSCPGSGNPDAVACTGAGCAGPYTATALTGGGIVLGTMPAGGAVVLTLVCRAL